MLGSERWARTSAATAAVAALAGRGARLIILALGFLGIAPGVGGASIRLGFRQRDPLERFDEFKAVAVRRLLKELKGFIAHRVALTALESVVIVVENFLKRAAVDHGLLAFEAITLFALERLDRHGTEFDA